MAEPSTARPTPAGANTLFGAILAGTLLFIVPTLALNGALLAAALAAVLGAVGLPALWLIHRAELRRHSRAFQLEHQAADLYRKVMEQTTEACLVLDRSGRVSFVGPNTTRVLDADPGRLEGGAPLLHLIRPDDRRRVLQEFAKIRRQAGASVVLEVATARGEGRDTFVELRATNLIEDPAVRGILVQARDITPRKTFESEIQHLAYFDALTGLANRRLFMEQGKRSLAMSRRLARPACVFFIDLDRFKQVNDILGHDAGDALLKRVADSLRDTLRETDVIARLGGDEFAVVLTEIRDVDSAGRVAHRVLDNMPSNVMAAGHEVPVTASIGLAMFPDDGEDLEELLKAADLAMYRAKSEALGIQYYRPELRELLSDRMRLEQEMRRALERHEFQLYYQPVFNLVTGAVVGVEALSRWRHFTRGMVPAADFIGLAETSGLIRSLDRWAIARAVQQRAASMDGDFGGWVAVNVSPQSLSDPGLPDYIRDVLTQYRLEPGALVLEIPGNTVTLDLAASVDLMWELKNTGAAIALDGYGVGAASLTGLRTLPLDILKLDPEFLARVGSDEGDERMVEGAIAIAHGIRAKVLAKGVERSEQAEWLLEAGCDFVQGYFMGRPVPPEELGQRPASAHGASSADPLTGDPASDTPAVRDPASDEPGARGTDTGGRRF
jgi:diguanylate cyclase (GGDEF)-like protein/PAS domain S-box-containing protein